MKYLVCILTILTICALSAGCTDSTEQTHKEEYTVLDGMGSSVRLIIIPDFAQDCGPDFSMWQSYPNKRCTKYQLQKIMSQPDNICDILKINTIYDGSDLEGAEIYLRKNTSIRCTL